jgi:hypothetical protein
MYINPLVSDRVVNATSRDIPSGMETFITSDRELPLEMV